jgi:hypothetical protein
MTISRESISANQVTSDFIVTRNIKDYKNSDIPVATPGIFLATLELSE